MDEKTTCTSCHVELMNNLGSTSFPCPKCGKRDIFRCFHCRQLAIKYVCSECEFEGPN